VPFDPSVHLPLDAQGSLGASASGIAFATSTGDILEISSYGPGVFRLRAGPANRPDYGIVTGRAQACTVTCPRPGTWVLAAGSTTLEIVETPLRVRLVHDNRQVLESCTDLCADGTPRLPAISRLRSGEQWTAAFALASGEPVYGLGEQFGPLDKRGQLVHSWVDDAEGVNTGRAYKCAPFAWSPGIAPAAKRGAWGLFVHTPGRVVHGVGYPEWSHRTYALAVDDEALDLFLFAAATPADVLDLYTQLTGRAPGVPPWSLGLWMSRDYHDTPDDAVALAAELRQRGIPCDVLALDDRAAWDAAMRFDQRWDRVRFPRAAAALADIRARGFRVCVSQSPYIPVDAPLFGELSGQGFLLSAEGGMPYICATDSGMETDRWSEALGIPQEFGFVDFTNPEAFAWWRDAHAKLFADGVDAVMSNGGERAPDDAIAFNGDTGRRLHNVHPLLYSQCLHEAAARFRRDADALPIALTRAGWAGSQRYPIASGGETQSDWEGLAASIRGALSWGMSGAPFHAAQVGGTYGPPPPAELWLRWLQAGVFGSHLRLHGNDGGRPWDFGAEAEAIAKKWLTFRYRLLPYLQRTVSAATRTGLPVMRAMALAFPGNALLRAYETQFMCGDALLVAPVVGPGGEVDVALPPGAWYDLNSRQRFPGLRVLRYRAALDQFPVFGREGHALPLGPAVQHTGEIDRLRPLDGLWLFGPPTQTLAGFVQVSIGTGTGESMVVDAVPELRVELFGDVAADRVVRRDRSHGTGAG
jgi:alpha-D-xyloside xylohydrolase